MTDAFHPSVSRRQWLTASAAALATPWAWGQSGRSATGLVVAQLVDFSQSQQEVSKDFLIGARAAWQDINANGGLQGKPVTHLVLETDGTPAAVRNALDSVKNNPACLALSGSVGDHMATQVIAQLAVARLGIAHAAPWLQNSSAKVDSHTFLIFSKRQDQITYAINNLRMLGMKELGVVYASAVEHAASHLEVQSLAQSLGLRLHTYQAAGSLRSMAQKINATAPMVLLFMGGTPELAEFTQGLGQQLNKRYVVAMSDVNLQTLTQMGGTKYLPIIATQPVPPVNAHRLPIVRAYRETLSRLFDEPPASLSLAGYMAARYTFEVLNKVDAPLNRQNALSAFLRRQNLDLGGFQISFDDKNQGSRYVAQSMMSTDGRLVS